MRGTPSLTMEQPTISKRRERNIYIQRSKITVSVSGGGMEGLDDRNWEHKWWEKCTEEG